VSGPLTEEEIAVLRRMIAAFLKVEGRAKRPPPAAPPAPPTIDLGPRGTRAEDDPAIGRLLCAEGLHAWGWKRDTCLRWHRVCMRCGAPAPDVKEGP
jgi:hypothetical protein